MQTFGIDAKALHGRKRIILARYIRGIVIGIFTYVLLGFFISPLIEHLWPSPHGVHHAIWPSIWPLTIGLIVGGLIGVSSSWLPASKRYTLAITGNRMTATLPESLFSSSISRGKIRTILELKENNYFYCCGAGLLMSKRSRLGAFLFGWVWVPKELPEYEYVREIAESWKGPANA